MKRLTATLLAAAMCMGTFAGCGSNTEETTDNSNAGAAAGETAAATTESQTASAENVHLDALNVYFVPSRDPEEIVTATEPLSDLLKNELAGLGYDVDSVNISVGTTYEAVGEALSAGTADVGFIPGGTYVLYDDGCDVILTATRDGLNKDSTIRRTGMMDSRQRHLTSRQYLTVLCSSQVLLRKDRSLQTR